MKPSLALYQPDIAGNTGTLLRLSACMGTDLHIIAPAGFRTDDTNLKRAGMDYLSLAQLTRHDDFEHFNQWRLENNKRLVLLTTKATQSYCDLKYNQNDILLLGRESSGVPQEVADKVDERILIPMNQEARSINQAISGAMALGEALRQTNSF
ncbi:MAG: tRNA (cytidine(34)-2'-O)-methyltransferase [Nitratireductor sp.]